MLKTTIFLLVFLIPQIALSLDPKKCFKVTHGNGLIKYDFPGYSSGEYITKKYGTTGGTTEYSMQSSIGSIDPMVTSGRSTSTSEFTSSDGGCSYYSQNRELRHEYFEKNGEFIMDQIAMGRGDHLEAIYFYSSCEDGGYQTFQREVQKSFPRLQLMKDASAKTEELDLIIKGNTKLSSLCYMNS